MTRRSPIILIWLFILAFTSASCLSYAEIIKQKYGILESAVTFSAEKIAGQYGDNIPDSLDDTTFLQVVRDKIPREYYEALIVYRLDVIPKKTYYLLKTYDMESGALILFDYSCTPELDGPVLLSPKEYDLNDLDRYNKCR